MLPFSGHLLHDAPMTSVDPNTWILGLDLGNRSRGAVLFADWFAGSDHTTAIHVLEQWSRPYIRNDVVSSVRELLHHISRELHITQPVRVAVIEASSAEDGLAKATEGAAGLILGRAARIDEDSRWRLGTVARRLLRRLPGPVIVVPPDLAAVAPGPVILATCLDEPSHEAAVFARNVAKRLGRPVIVAHIGEARHSDLIDELEPTWLAAREAYREQLAAAVHRWMTVHSLADCDRHVAYGNPTEELSALVTATAAAMVVVGSRRLGTVGRVFLGSTASTLAGQAPCPVAVVPPSE